jgi:hypothetical protein
MMFVFDLFYFYMSNRMNVCLFAVWTVFYAQTAHRTASDVFVFPFHKLTALCRIEKAVPVNTPVFAADGAAGASVTADVAVGAWIWRKLCGVFKLTVGKHRAQSYRRTKVFVQKQTVVAHIAKTCKGCYFFVGISSAIVPALIVYGLTACHGYIVITVLLQQHTNAQKTMVDKAVYTAVMVEIGVGGFCVNLIDYRIGQAHHNAYRIAKSPCTVLCVAKAHIAYTKCFHQLFYFGLNVCHKINVSLSTISQI